MTAHEPGPEPEIMPDELPQYADMLEARERIDPWIHRTPVLTSASLDRLVGASLFFKCENLQKAGAFKTRGAVNAVLALDGEGEPGGGVSTHSSGNHASSLGYAARIRNLPCHVVMPEDAPQSKKDAVQRYGAIVHLCEPTSEAREVAEAGVRARFSTRFIHPYADRRVIAGQASCAAELLEAVADLDVVMAPIGGGGLISGTCLTVGGQAPHIRVIAAEPARADDAARSFQAGRLMGLDPPQTVADGLKVPLKPLTWHFVSRFVDDVLTVGEPEILQAMKLCWQTLKTVIEPSSAVPLAALWNHRARFAGKRVGVILTGGNLDPEHIPWHVAGS